MKQKVPSKRLAMRTASTLFPETLAYFNSQQEKGMLKDWKLIFSIDGQRVNFHQKGSLVSFSTDRTALQYCRNNAEPFKSKPSGNKKSDDAD